MENLSPQEEPDFITFDSLCIQHLRSTRKWTKFLSLLGFIFIGFAVIIIGIVSMQFFNGSSSILAILPMTIIALIYFFPIYFLWQFSTQSKSAIEYKDTESLRKAMMYLNRHYTFMGVLVLVMIVCYLIAGIAMVVSGKMFGFL
ncbi:MAG: hypothetical protein H7Y13_16060 [Sphingobacteriaceae bacterium]|nr:hypothetical protein [Sphingobacteriaceae bacterium]